MRQTKISPSPEKEVQHSISPISQRALNLLTIISSLTQELLEATSWSEATERFLSNLGQACEAHQLQLCQITSDTVERLAVWPASSFEQMPAGCDIVPRPVLDRLQAQPLWLEPVDSLRAPVLLAPIFGKGVLWGVLALELSPTVSRWSPEEVVAIQAVANVWGSVMIGHQHTDQSHKAFHKHEPRYQQMFTRHKAVMLLIDPETGSIVDANPAAARFYGYHHDDLVKLKITDINMLPPEEVQAEMEQAKAERRNFFVFLHRLASGEIREVEVHSGPVEVGEQVLLNSIIFDITERKKAERALLESEARFRRLTEHAPVGIYESTLEGKFLYGNPALAQILQQPSVEMMMQQITPTFYKHPEDRARFIELLREWGIVTHFETELSVRDGSSKHTLLSAALQGEKLIGTIVDITERKNAEKQLQQTLQNLRRSNRDLQQFAYVASHDLQEPLRMVSSYLELLEKRYKGRLDERADKYIHFAVDGAIRMKRLINDLLTYSRVTAHSSVLSRTDLNEAVQNVLKNLKVLIDESGSVITHDPLPILNVDTTQIELLLQNLLSNAIKFRGEKSPKIHLGARQTESEWIVWIRDNGIGIEPEYQDQIFTIFKRLHTREEYEGTGIGLAVCKRIIEQHSGRIWLESEPGQGSTFFFALPKPEEL